MCVCVSASKRKHTNLFHLVPPILHVCDWRLVHSSVSKAHIYYIYIYIHVFFGMLFYIRRTHTATCSRVFMLFKYQEQCMLYSRNIFVVLCRTNEFGADKKGHKFLVIIWTQRQKCTPEYTLLRLKQKRAKAISMQSGKLDPNARTAIAFKTICHIYA